MMRSITGVVTSEQLKEFAALPFGEAADRIRRYDPMWGLPEGAEIEWVVTVRAKIGGIAVVKAASKQQAEKVADRLKESEIDWDYPIDVFEIDQIRPSKPSPAKTMAEGTPSLFPEQGRRGILDKE